MEEQNRSLLLTISPVYKHIAKATNCNFVQCDCVILDPTREIQGQGVSCLYQPVISERVVYSLTTCKTRLVVLSEQNVIGRRRTKF
jgi:hypothetical protein